MGGHTIDQSHDSSSSINLNDEREVTKLCLRICEDARLHLESLINQESQSTSEGDEECRFEARLLTRQTLDENRDSFVRIIARLRSRLESMVSTNNPEDEKERSRLVEDINTSKDCLEVCKVASEVSSQKIYRIGEVVAEGDSDQVVVTTLADLFDIKKALSKGKSAQLVGSMGEETLQHLGTKRYDSRFGAVAQKPDSVQAAVNKPAPVVQDASPNQTDRVVESSRPATKNEVRKRV